MIIQITFLKGWMLLLAETTTFLALSVLAVVEDASNRTLIYVSLIGSATTIIMTYMNGRTARQAAAMSKENSKTLAPLAQLPSTIEQLRKTVDGNFADLRQAEKGKERAEGIIEGGDKARAAGVTATAVATETDSEKVTKMEIISSDQNPVTTKPAKLAD